MGQREMIFPPLIFCKPRIKALQYTEKSAPQI